MALDKLTFIKEQSKLALGHPIMDSELSDSDIHDGSTPKVYLQGALLDYYRNAPYKVNKVVSPGSFVDLTEVVTDVASRSGLDTSDIYYVGVLNLQMAEDDFFYGLDTQILTDEISVDISGETYFDQILQSTAKDMYTGDPYYSYDALERKIYIVKGVYGDVTVTIGFGFNSVDFIPPAHLPTVAKLTALKFLEAAISMRSSATLEIPVKLESDYLQVLYDKLKEELDLEMLDQRQAMMMWG